MNLTEWQRFFVAQGEWLATIYPEWPRLIGPEKPADRLLELDHQTTNEVEGAVRQFVANGEWPAMTIPGGAMLLLRISAALHQLEWLEWSQAGLPDTQWPNEKWICWFLLDGWQETGFGQIHCMFADLPPSGSESSDWKLN